ncbi:GH1 family beta-glucosidase [uncultured Cytophaga sp.]|uniref:GH1 family beta-glucosidase n=1 Tax=uncultured Cytophaga sp. TaxID=160238 RepID=UPI00263354CD|nr:GH1 family beta-glucosidase [uncultured Cytophaga sp.]
MIHFEPNQSNLFIPDTLSTYKKNLDTTFIWGVSTSAYQTEGGYNVDGKGPSIWDTFTNKDTHKIRDKKNGNIACDFYSRYEEDLKLMHALGINHFRFSISWARILPYGIGEINPAGVAFYDRLIDACLKYNITPWITLYHWDLPQALENKGGWTNREVVNWFTSYVSICVKYFGDRVSNWMVMNEPMVFVGAGYFLGIHAPGRRGMKNFLPAIHHAVLSMCEGARAIKSIQPGANVGTTFSCSHIEPYRNIDKDVLAAHRMDALLNRLFIEPTLGMGYPTDVLKPLQPIHQYILQGDEYKMQFNFDFIGVQNYTREFVKHSWLTPYLKARLVSAPDRNVQHTLMNWEVYPQSIYHMIKKFDAYPGIKKILITENGAAFEDTHHERIIADHLRTIFLQDHIEQVLKAKKEGAKVEGYFVWTWTDNFEWAEGFYPRFGLIYTDFNTQKRIVKESGAWYGNFIRG